MCEIFQNKNDCFYRDDRFEGAIICLTARVYCHANHFHQIMSALLPSLFPTRNQNARAFVPYSTLVCFFPIFRSL